MNLNEIQIEWLANHLGHSVQIHKDVYRQYDCTLEMAKVSAILLAVDRGESKQFAKKTLEEITIQGNSNSKNSITL